MATAGAASGESAGGDTCQQASWGSNLHHLGLAGWLYHVFDAHSLWRYDEPHSLLSYQMSPYVLDCCPHKNPYSRNLPAS
jgi:hypothetical protein